MGPVELYLGDARQVLQDMPDRSIDCVATSPPFWELRDYGTGRWEGGRSDCDHEHRPSERSSGATCRQWPAVWVDSQYGLESDVQIYVDQLIAVFDQLRRVLTQAGTRLDLGDPFTGGPRHAHSPGGREPVGRL
ncbi:hypothetical protein ACQP2X_39470 [Actinoplanes sp. CA-131856]